MQGAAVEVWTDGSAIDNASDDIKAGAGVYFGQNNPMNMAIRVPDNLGPSNQVGEILAIKEAVEIAPLDAPLKIYSDSKYAIDGLTRNLNKWEDDGFLTVQNGDLFELTVAKIRERRAQTELEWVKGHSGVPGNEAADLLAGEGSRKEEPDERNTDALRSLTLPGAKLSKITQASAYQMIRKTEMETPAIHALLGRKATKKNIKLAKEAAADINGAPPARKIWKSIRDKEISRNIWFFMWMLIHDGYKVGHFWDHIPEHRWKGYCTNCETSETMEYILTECNEPGQKEIWDLASEMWRKKVNKDMRPTVAQIMACTATKVGNLGEKRLYKILITESAHLIWKLRNERRIQQKDAASFPEIKNRWLRAINGRLAIDCAMTDKYKWGRKAVTISLVKSTWKRTLKDEHTLPQDWCRSSASRLCIVTVLFAQRSA
ncbi:ribonuclease H-like domain-containing protein [Mycena galopus ATCC 62051]|nr:ribonuclease H-like domain-containing protein [Mycena galopus ATCC 62051]